MEKEKTAENSESKEINISRRSILASAATGGGTLLLGSGDVHARTTWPEIGDQQRKKRHSYYDDIDNIRREFQSYTDDLIKYLKHFDRLDVDSLDPILESIDDQTHVGVVKEDGEIVTILQEEIEVESGLLKIVVYPEIATGWALFDHSGTAKTTIFDPRKDPATFEIDPPSPDCYCYTTNCQGDPCDCEDVAGEDPPCSDYPQTIYRRCCCSSSCGSWSAYECCN